jgi:hypothetical protein
MRRSVFVAPTNFVAENLPEDGTLVPKYVGFCPWYEMFFVVCIFYFNLLKPTGFVRQ